MFSEYKKMWRRTTGKKAEVFRLYSAISANIRIQEERLTAMDQ